MGDLCDNSRTCGGMSFEWKYICHCITCCHDTALQDNQLQSGLTGNFMWTLNPRRNMQKRRGLELLISSLVPRPSARGGGGRPGTHCMRMRVIFAEIT